MSMIGTLSQAQRGKTDKNTSSSQVIDVTPAFTDHVDSSSGRANMDDQCVFNTIANGLTRAHNHSNDNNNLMNSVGNNSLIENNNTMNPRLKRSVPSSCNYIGENLIKRRLPNQEEGFLQQSQFLDANLTVNTGIANQSISIPNTPSRPPTSRRPSLPKKAPDTSSISNTGNGGGGAYIFGSPHFSLPNISASVSNVDFASRTAMEMSIQKLPFLEKGSSSFLQTTPSKLGASYFIPDQNGDKHCHHGIPLHSLVSNGVNHNNSMNTINNTNTNDNNYCNNNCFSMSGRKQVSNAAGPDTFVNLPNSNNDVNTNTTTNDNEAGLDVTGNRVDNDGNQDATHNNVNSNEGNSNVTGNGSSDNHEKNSNNNDGNNNNNRAVPSVVVPSKRSSQALVQKLQDIYKLIVKQEIELQEKCSQLTASQTTELKNLWSIYKINCELINNYVTFLTTALLPSQTEPDILIGEEIVEIYRIERRLWVYGTITFLDVFKNFSNFMDPEVCCQFITHVFISISNMLGDIPPKYGISWLQRLGDLSRMAIALYPSGFIDWKLSAEHWYREAMKFTYSHGKLYYHMSTVQQNTLEAFVNLGKSVFCQDTFIPSQQYMQLVIDNIYQRAFVERNNGSHRNAQLIEYLKHSEVMLLPSFLESSDLQQVVLIYFKAKFGCDSDNANIFDARRMFNQNPDYLKYIFRHAPAFAESHILQLVGFGDPKNPFALLFELPKYLKERRDKKEKKRVRPTILTGTSSSIAADDFIYEQQFGRISTPEGFFENVESFRLPYSMPFNLEIWNESLNYINMTSLKCGMIVLQKFLNGPMVVALPHLIPWTYFIISVAYKIRSLNNKSSQAFWIEFVNRIFPWNTIVSFLNMLMAYMLDNSWKSSLINSLCNQFSTMGLQGILDYFNNNEILPEVWKCWGTLWFDIICNKDIHHAEDFGSVGVKNHMFLDSPVDGITFDDNDENGQNFWQRACRIIFLFKGLAENFSIGITLTSMAPIYCRRNDIDSHHPLNGFSFKLGRKDMDYGTIDLYHLRHTIEHFEQDSWVNVHISAIPTLSVREGESIFDYDGYKRLYSDYSSYDKNGEFLSASLYTSWYTSGCTINNNLRLHEDIGVKGEVVQEAHIFNRIMEPGCCANFTDDEFLIDALRHTQSPYSNTTFFILDTTTWLRHFGHIYKLATNGVLKFAICLTTFHELRFLRKPRDENVVEAATRAIITVRQLYNEGNLLPLRFTGNIATHIEEHLEFEEKITWRSHVDEFVIEAVSKAQSKFRAMNQQLVLQQKGGLRFVVLVTDDSDMAEKARIHDLRTFSTKFVFALSNSVSLHNKICIN